MPPSPTPGRSALAALLAPLLLTAAARAGGAQAPDSTARAQRLAGSARVALDGETGRIDGGQFHTYTVSPAAYPFVGEHLQVGLAPGYTRSTFAGPTSTSTFQSYALAAVVNYVVGGGGRWRGYAGAYGARTEYRSATTEQRPGPTSSVTRFGQAGGQAGALYFLDPAVAVRAELRLRAPTQGPERSLTTQVLVRLDPYLFGRADDGAPEAAGFGTVDVDAYGGRYDAPSAHYHVWSGGLLVAPYLTRWAQLGLEASGERRSDYGGLGNYVARGFGRLYLPLTTRTQPFVEGFVQRGDYAYIDRGPAFGGTLGVRRLLNRRVALDAGLRRRLEPRQIFAGFETHLPGQTGFVVGLATRVGRAR